jgi:hypothetical protein
MIDDLDLRYRKSAVGTLRGMFKDCQSQRCSISRSSSADAIWLGLAEPQPCFMTDQGWIDYPLPEAVQNNARMHLSRNQVAELLPILQLFVDEGVIGPGDIPDKAPFNDAPTTLEEWRSNAHLYADDLDAAFAENKQLRADNMTMRAQLDRLTQLKAM